MITITLKFFDSLNMHLNVRCDSCEQQLTNILPGLARVRDAAPTKDIILNGMLAEFGEVCPHMESLKVI